MVTTLKLSKCNWMSKCLRGIEWMSRSARTGTVEDSNAGRASEWGCVWCLPSETTHFCNFCCQNAVRVTGASTNRSELNGKTDFIVRAWAATTALTLVFSPWFKKKKTCHGSCWIGTCRFVYLQIFFPPILKKKIYIYFPFPQFPLFFIENWRFIHI